jgi:hypothetical protein
MYLTSLKSFHTPKRWHSTVGYISPVKFEEVLFAKVGAHGVSSNP